MTLEHAGRSRAHRLAVGDVAHFVLVGGRRSARETDHVRASGLQLPDELGADPGGGAGDDGYLQTRSCRPAAALRPERSTTVAVRRCTPRFSLLVCHVTL